MHRDCLYKVYGPYGGAGVMIGYALKRCVMCVERVCWQLGEHVGRLCVDHLGRCLRGSIATSVLGWSLHDSSTRNRAVIVAFVVHGLMVESRWKRQRQDGKKPMGVLQVTVDRDGNRLGVNINRSG